MTASPYPFNDANIGKFNNNEPIPAGATAALSQKLDNAASTLEQALHNPLFRNDTSKSATAQPLASEIIFQGKSFQQLKEKMSKPQFTAKKMQRWIKQGFNPNKTNLSGKRLFDVVVSNFGDLPNEQLLPILQVMLDTGKIKLTQPNKEGLKAKDYAGPNVRLIEFLDSSEKSQRMKNP